MSDNLDGDVLVAGRTCWQLADADRFSPIVDGADYFLHVKSAMLAARHRIMIVGWDLDHRTALERVDPVCDGPDRLGSFVHWLLRRRSDLQVYLLKSNLRLFPAFDRFWAGVTPVSLLNSVTSGRLRFAVDGAHPTGAVHHQKIVVVDDVVAFCGGIDLTLGRWDTRAHRSVEKGRRNLGRSYGPRHEVAAAVDGAAAAVLAEQARQRWDAATGEQLEPVRGAEPIWPDRLTPALRDVEVAFARTQPELPGRSEIREVEALNLAAIAAARDVIYLENQYLAARALAEALAERLREPDGPEVVIVLPRGAESRLEKESMDSARERLLTLLWEADRHGRFGVYWPVDDSGTPVYVHAKVMVIDDRLLRIGSSNLNNRSLGFDSECDVAVEARPGGADRDHVARQIVNFRNGLVAEHLGVPGERLHDEITRQRSFLAAIDELRTADRSLRRFTPFMASADAGPLAENDLMDPDHVPPSLGHSVGDLIGGLSAWPWRLVRRGR